MRRLSQRLRVFPPLQDLFHLLQQEANAPVDAEYKEFVLQKSQVLEEDVEDVIKLEGGTRVVQDLEVVFEGFLDAVIGGKRDNEVVDGRVHGGEGGETEDVEQD